MPRAKTPAEFARKYKADTTGSYAQRCAAFLNAGADELPYRFFDRRLVAKVAYGLSRAPGEESVYMRKLSSVLCGANEILKKDHNREVWTDRLEGIRATVDLSDLAKTKRRKKVRRVASSVRSLDETDQMIDINQIKDAKLKREIQVTRREKNKLLDIVNKLPQLPPKAGNEKDSEEE